MSIEYSKAGNYHFPNLKHKSNVQLSKYGRMKLQYLKNYRQGLYHKLLANNELNEYLLLIDKEANELYDKLIVDIKNQRNITEKLKEENQIQWVQEMDNIQNCIGEVIKKEIIYR